jgi:hypothetical protein
MKHPKEICLDFPRVALVLSSQCTMPLDNHLSCVFPTALFTLEHNRDLIFRKNGMIPYK